MRIVVLAKVVTDRARIRPRPDGFAARDPADAVLNPFDQRALRVALELRAPEDRTIVLSMGPLTTAPRLAPLREAGFDRVLLLADEGLAGSDLGATGRALAAALRPLSPDLLLLGARATDSDVGALPAVVAGALGLPLVTGADRIERSGGALRVRAESDEAGAEYVLSAPCAISVGEKISKPLKPPAVDVARVADLVETIGPGPLGLGVQPIGLSGPAWRWAGSVEVEIRRTPVRFSSAEARVAIAAARSLVDARPRAPRFPLPRASLDRPSAPLGLLLTGADGRLERRIARVAPALGAWLPGREIVGLWVGPDACPAVDPRLGVSEIHELRAATAPVPHEAAARAVERLIDARGDLGGFAFVDTGFGRDVAGRVAGIRGLPLVTGVEEAQDGPAGIAWWKESWGSTAVVAVRAARGFPLATIRLPRSVPRPPGSPVEPRVRSSPGPPVAGGPAAVSWTSRARPDLGDVETASILFVVGQGIGGPDAVSRLSAASRSLDCAIAGTRRVVDAGWLPLDRQVGLTGRSLDPDIAILLGVAGSSNHLIGLRRARAILTVNPDPAAPVFRSADIGILARAEEVLPEILAGLG